jgi:hypothetical protein
MLQSLEKTGINRVMHHEFCSSSHAVPVWWLRETVTIVSSPLQTASSQTSLLTGMLAAPVSAYRHPDTDLRSRTQRPA